MQSNGLPRAISAVESAWFILESLKMFTAMEAEFDQSIPRGTWSPKDEIEEMFENLEVSVGTLLQDRLPEVVLEHKALVASEDRLIGKMAWAPAHNYLMSLKPTERIDLTKDLPDLATVSARKIQMAMGAARLEGSSRACRTFSAAIDDMNAETQTFTYSVEIEGYEITAATAALDRNQQVNFAIGLNLLRTDGKVRSVHDIITCGFPSGFSNSDIPGRLKGKDVVLDLGTRPQTGLKAALEGLKAQSYLEANTRRTVQQGFLRSAENLQEGVNEIQENIKLIRELVLPELEFWQP